MNSVQTAILNETLYPIVVVKDDIDHIESAFSYFNKITVIILYVQMGFGLTLNFISISCILFAFLHSKAYTSINVLIVNLAVSDIMYISIIPAFVKQFDPSVFFNNPNELICRLSFSLDVIGMIVSVYTVAALTIERYYCLRVQKMIENDKSKLKVILVYIVFLWTSAICFTLPKTLSIKISSEQTDALTNDCISSFDETDEKIFTSLKLLIAFAIPYTIIIIFSIFLLKFLNEWSKKARSLTKYQRSTFFLFKSLNNITNYSTENDHTPLKIANETKTNTLNVPTHSLHGIKQSMSLQMTKSNSTMHINKCISKVSLSSDKTRLEIDRISKLPLKKSSSFNSTANDLVNLTSSHRHTRLEMIKRRSTKFVISVVISFLCCWSPLWLFQLIMSFYDPKNSHFMRLCNNLTLIIVYLSCVFNPLLYMFLTENFREYAREILKKFRF